MAKNIAQQAAFIILDAAVAHGAESSTGSPMNLAIRRLNDVPGMVTVTDVGTSRTVDVSPIVNASIVSTYVLAFWLAQQRGVPIEEVFAELRDTHEGLWDE
ncbi:MULTISPECIES: hypothetical protein [unclassified Microbacterium]|uniref:hypothetical protein n=1 Tax=unclassified Microbacterium TaxID=2609290 RepID=UPI00343A6D3F